MPRTRGRVSPRHSSANVGHMTQMPMLHEERLDRATALLKATGARTVLDLGCGSGSLIARLLNDPQFEQVTGLEQSGQSLQQARQMFAGYLDHSPERLRLIRGSYTQLDGTDHSADLAGFDTAAMIETVEHVPPEQLSLVERTVFGGFQPGCLLMTTPNREYNSLFGLAPGEFREPDHKFEWDRPRFQKWARGVAQRNGYQVTFGGIGDYADDVGHPTQTAMFTRLNDQPPVTDDDARR